MRFNSVIIAGVMLMAAASTPDFAQQYQRPMYNDDHMQVELQACESDVYTLCGQAIPDQNRIEKCLRSKWNRVSHKCRSAMASYGRRHRGYDGQRY